MMQDFDGLLLAGERVLWRGAPDFSLAKGKLPPRWRARLTMAAWALGFIAATTAAVIYGHTPGMDGFLGLLNGLVALLLGAISVGLVIGIFNARPEFDPKTDPTYLLTNFRLVSLDATGNRYSLLTRNIAGIRLTPEAGAFDLHVWTRSDEGPALTLFSLPDGPAVERLILETLSHPTPDTPQ
jgi:hypothetical protein